MRVDVFIGSASDYDSDLSVIIGEGLRELGVDGSGISGKRVVLKPNLVETAPTASPINTHPSVVVAVADAMRRLGAADVFVAEGPGHRRDSWLVLEESGMRRALSEAGLGYVDLNHDDIVPVDNTGRWSELSPLYLPRTLLSADLVVSVAKLKTHHWSGITCAMKNMFGVMPGVVYGWPKNPLHHAGIARSILDINATVGPHLSIVDGIIGMEGDGPIMGKPKRADCIVMGASAVAVDATCARIMGIEPSAVAYLSGASGVLGPIHEWNIRQCGEAIDSVRTQFDLIDVPHLTELRAVL